MLSEFKKKHSPRRKYLVGVSGGRDSVALVELLLEEGFRNLVLCHVNHGLRGRAAAGDAAFVRRFAKKRGLPFAIEKVDVAALAKRRKVSIETAARAARLEAFASWSAVHGSRRILLAHHADDQVETILMKLMRGAGPEGLEGMREVSEQRVGRRRLELIRPLLGLWREDIDAWIRARGLSYREDLSNREQPFLRNRVRFELLPALRELFGRDVRGAVWRLGVLAREENAFFEGILEELPVDDPQIAVARLRGQHPAVQRRWVRRWLQGRGVAGVGFREVEAVRQLADPGCARAKVNLPGDRFARRRAGRIFLE